MVFNLGIFIMGFTWGMGLTLLVLISLDIRLRRERQKVKQEKEKPTFLFIDYGYDPKECEECHLPGDCPLCGAD